MPSWLRQSTALTLKMGPFLDSVDADSEETALTITQPDVLLSKAGGALTQKNAAGTLTHDVKGWYGVPLDTTDTNTLGILLVAIHESGSLAVSREYMVVPALIYDAIVAGSTLASEVTTILAAVDTEVAAIKSDTTAILTDTGTTLDGMLVTLQASATAIKAVTDLLVIASGRVNANLMAVNSNAGIPAIMERAFEAEVLVTIGVGSTTTSLVTSSMDPAAVVTDQYRGRIFIFSKTTATTQLRGQAGRITGMTSGGVLAFSALEPFSTSAASGDIGGIF